MAFSEATLKENYRKLSNEKLLGIAAEDAAKLRPEALTLLREELEVRGLAQTTQAGIDAQLRVLSAAEIDEYCALLRAVPCPICHSAAQPLNATVTSTVSSFIVVTTSKEKLAVACLGCLDKLSEKAISHSMFLGWWGIIRTVQALLFNKKMAKSHHALHANPLLKAFVVDDFRAVDAAEGNVNKLHAFLISSSLS